MRYIRVAHGKALTVDLTGAAVRGPMKATLTIGGQQHALDVMDGKVTIPGDLHQALPLPDVLRHHECDLQYGSMKCCICLVCDPTSHAMEVKHRWPLI